MREPTASLRYVCPACQRPTAPASGFGARVSLRPHRTPKGKPCRAAGKPFVWSTLAVVPPVVAP